MDGKTQIRTGVVYRVATHLSLVTCHYYAPASREFRSPYLAALDLEPARGADAGLGRQLADAQARRERGAGARVPRAVSLGGRSQHVCDRTRQPSGHAARA